MCVRLTQSRAGNCHDVSLNRLAELFRRIHLVDVDLSAIGNASAASGCADEIIELHGPLDIAEPLMAMTTRDFDSADQSRLTNSLQLLSSPNGVAEVPEADVVVSLCLFSQMILSLSALLPQTDAGFATALKALRVGHMRRMMSMLRPGGVAVYVTDIVSSETAPELRTVSDSELPELIQKLVSDSNFFSGTSPSPLLTELNLLSRLPGGPETVDTIDPWKWQVGERTYAVYAMRIQKKVPLGEEAPAADEDTD